MQNFFMISGIVSIMFFILKFIEMRFVTKENKTLKQVIVDTFVVFISTIIGSFIIDKIDIKKAEFNAAPAFTDGPGF